MGRKDIKQSLSIALVATGVLVLIGWLVLMFVFKKEGLPITTAALALVGISISLEYNGEKFRWLVRALQGIAVLLIAITVVVWFVTLPKAALNVLNAAALAINVPLAGFGLSHKYNQPKKENDEWN